MRFKLITYLFLSPVIFLAMAMPLSAQSENGGYAGAMLQIDLSPRATGMGGAYTAVSDDIYGLFVNPGAAAQIQRNSFGGAYRDMSLGRSLQQIAVLFPVRQEAAIGLTAQLATVKDVMGRTTRGEPTDNLSNYDAAFGIVFSRRFSRYLTFGGDARYYYKRLETASAYSAGFDAGAMLHLDSTTVINPDGLLDLVRLAAVVRNIETKYPWNTGDYWAHQGYLGTNVKEKVPMIVKLGGSVLMLDRRLLFALDGEWDEKRSVGAYAGAEFKITSIFALRGGLARGEPAFGVGASSKVGEMHLQIDLAVEQSQNLGDWETIIGLIVSN